MSELKTCFKRVEYELENLLTYIDVGDIGLPDIQRPFVWTNAKVRDLFDSMYKGFPVGYLLFWANGTANGSRQIGADGKQRIPNLLIVDGQQRLTSLYAVFKGKKVIDDDYKERNIEIAFCPRNGKFEVADAAIRRDPEWIPDISSLWADGKSSYKLIKEFIKKLSEKTVLTEVENEAIAKNLDRLFDLHKYPFTALEIAQTVEEELVADIFVRINSEGVKLNQADFILTLLSVFWDAGRKELETFCWASRFAPKPDDPPSPFNHLIKPDPDQLLRVAVAIGFYRGRLKSVYHILRGKNLDTGEFSNDLRDKQFEILKNTQKHLLNLTNWHQFLSALIGAGFRTSQMITSQNALMYAYAFYLIGRIRFNIPDNVLQKLIGRWFFFISLKGRYTASFESKMDADLNRINGIKNSTQFIDILDEIIFSEFTNDYWDISLPIALDNSAARGPEMFAFIAAQNILNAPVLFSHKRIPDLLDPSLKTVKSPLERHHLFPKNWLEKQGLDDLKHINQQANLTLIEWPENLDILDSSPVQYVPKIKARFSKEDWEAMNKYHAMPDGWENLQYDDFLIQRRNLMAKIIKQGFEKLLINP